MSKRPTKQEATQGRRATFRDAVADAPSPVSQAYRPGKQALERRHRTLVTCSDTQRLTGSIDLDATLAQEPDYANQSRGITASATSRQGDLSERCGSRYTRLRRGKCRPSSGSWSGSAHGFAPRPSTSTDSRTMLERTASSGLPAMETTFHAIPRSFGDYNGPPFGSRESGSP